MGRCVIDKNLIVTFKHIDGGNDINNSIVLCERCNMNMELNGLISAKNLPLFSEKTKKAAFVRAENYCECIKEECHYDHEAFNKSIINASNIFANKKK